MKLKTLGLLGPKFCIGNVCFPVKAQGKQCSLHGRRGKGRENGEIIRELGALKEGGGCACYQAIFFAVFLLSPCECENPDRNNFMSISEVKWL